MARGGHRLRREADDGHRLRREADDDVDARGATRSASGAQRKSKCDLGWEVRDKIFGERNVSTSTVSTKGSPQRSVLPTVFPSVGYISQGIQGVHSRPPSGCQCQSGVGIGPPTRFDSLLLGSLVPLPEGSVVPLPEGIPVSPRDSTRCCLPPSAVDVSYHPGAVGARCPHPRSRIVSRRTSYRPLLVGVRCWNNSSNLRCRPGDDPSHDPKRRPHQQGRSISSNPQSRRRPSRKGS